MSGLIAQLLVVDFEVELHAALGVTHGQFPSIVRLNQFHTGGGRTALLWKDGLYRFQDHRRNLLNPSYNRIGIGVCGHRGTYLFTQDFASVTVEILSYQVTPVAGGYQLQLRTRVHSGPRQGALLFAGKRCGDWVARPDGEFEVTSLLPALGVVQIGQSVGPLNWEVETELELKG
ncbi:hypothetical protein IV102_13880 [bacterium]|nr:hypothetical protein [bacterium]